MRDYEFVSYDDPAFLTDNPIVRQGLTWGGIRWAFRTRETGNWQPVTWISHMIDCQLFGMDAGWHHLVNVGLHSANAVLLFLLIRSLTGALWPSALVAALFAWHPLRVQSVAWAAERKDVLSAFFALLSLCAYVRYAHKQTRRQQGDPDGSGATDALAQRPPSFDYAWALAFFALGLMAKPMLVTLPFVLLLLDFWPLSRLSFRSDSERSSGWRFNGRRLLVEKRPFFALTALVCWVAFTAQRSTGAVVSLAQHPLSERLRDLAPAYVTYLLKTICPVDLAFFYPMPTALSPFVVGGALALLAVISWSAWRLRRREPCLLMGWLWFVGMLVPVIGLVQVGDQFIADRYTYLPSIGLFVAAVFGVTNRFKSGRRQSALWRPVAIAMLGACLWGTSCELPYWHDSEALFTRALDVTQNNFIALTNLGALYLQRGRTSEAVDLLKQATEIESGDSKAQNDLGLGLVKLGRLDEAESSYQKAIAVNPRYVQAYENLGALYLLMKRPDAAITALQTVLRFQPSAHAFNDLGVAQMHSGRKEQGLEAFRRAVELEPDNGRYRKNLGYALAEQGKVDEAAQYFPHP